MRLEGVTTPISPPQLARALSDYKGEQVVIAFNPEEGWLEVNCRITRKKLLEIIESHEIDQLTVVVPETRKPKPRGDAR
jgi:hypothetical protein